MSPLAAFALAGVALAADASGGRAADREVAPIATGARMPALAGRDLTGRAVTLPEDARGKVTLVALGFTYGSRHAVEAWSKAFREAFREQPAATFFEVPMLGGAARIARPFIDRGMRRGTPRELHGNVVTVWGETSRWKKAVGYAERDAAYLLLLDPEGVVRWTHAGAPDDAGLDEMRARARDLLEAASP